jgi:hypothetical protein
MNNYPVDLVQHLETVWEALHVYREHLIPEGNEQYNEIWSDICTSMAIITENLIPECEAEDTP